MAWNFTNKFTKYVPQRFIIPNTSNSYGWRWYIIKIFAVLMQITCTFFYQLMLNTLQLVHSWITIHFSRCMNNFYHKMQFVRFWIGGKLYMQRVSHDVKSCMELILIGGNQTDIICFWFYAVVVKKNGN